MTRSFTLHDGRQVKLGRIRPKARPNALRLGAYFNPKDATPPPTAVDYYTKAMPAIQQVLGNDQQGCCTVSSIMHRIGSWTANESGTPAIGTTQEALAQYHQIGGPGDNGLVITDVLDWAKSHGFVVGGKTYKIVGYVALNWTNQVLSQVAIDLLGGVTLGIALPQDWMQNPNVWDVTSSPVIGGHDVPILGYTADGVVIATWGGIRTITWRAFLSKQYVDEAYVSLSPDWYSKANKNPNGVDAGALAADMDKIGGGEIPPLDPIAPPWSWDNWGW